jgi:TPP-dependent pyruvate/acetoin dehydrogenase alpha subunit
MLLHAAPDRSPASPIVPSAPDNVVRAMHDDAVDAAFRQALDVGVSLHRHMVRARLVSARMVALQRSGKVGYHSASIGEEAAIVGAVLGMRETDWIFPGAREWYAALARGLPLGAYVHQAFGSTDDPAKGHAAPDHVPARQFHVVPPSGVVGAHLPQAVGAAWAARIAKQDVAALALFGAEVAESGDFHNALNFAGVFKAPAVFVCRSGPAKRIADRAVAYGLASARVDGGDALAVYTVVKAAVARATEGKGATLIEVIVPSVAGLTLLANDDHVLDSARVLDLGADDPLTRLGRVLTHESLDGRGAAAFADEVRAELDDAVSAAERAGAPPPTTIFDHVYAGVPAHLAAQRRMLLEAPRSDAEGATSSGGAGEAQPLQNRGG